MKLTLLLLISVLASSSPCLQASDAARDPVFRPQTSFTEFNGLEVRNLQNEKLGRVKFITADVENARLVEVVVVSGGFLGMGVKATPVPPRALALDTASHVMRVDVSKERFSAAPKFDLSDIAASSARDRVAAVDRYFGLEPWFYLEGQVVKKNTRLLRLGHVERSDRLIGMRIRNKNGDSMGVIDSVRMDLSQGQIVHLTSATGAKDHPLSVIQPRAIKYNTFHDGFVLDDSLGELADEPKFKWTDGSRTSYREEAYMNRDSGSSAMDQGSNYRDQQKTARVKAMLQAEPTLAAQAGGIHVATLNAQTTLRGHVSSSEAKRKAGELAMQAGRPENVSNQLEVTR
jgi:sporulation protein YlmC with PRC-barrel domain